jgi:hypothetical protein
MTENLTPNSEDTWRLEFENVGEAQIRDALNRGNLSGNEPRRQFAFRWLAERQTKKEFREQKIYSYMQWTFWAAVAAVFVGIIGVIVTLLH